MTSTNSIQDISALLSTSGYVADEDIATAIFLAMRLRRPLLVEGYAGVGKTEIAKVLAGALNTDLIRLQCYEGLDAASSLYEWNYAKQILRIRLDEQSSHDAADTEAHIFDEAYLLERPLLNALRHGGNPVLLIDEIDKADIEFPKDLLLEIDRMEFYVYETKQIVKAKHRPIIIITSKDPAEAI